jgi:hypothetical protein
VCEVRYCWLKRCCPWLTCPGQCKAGACQWLHHALSARLHPGIPWYVSVRPSCVCTRSARKARTSGKDRCNDDTEAWLMRVCRRLLSGRSTLPPAEEMVAAIQQHAAQLAAEGMPAEQRCAWQHMSCTQFQYQPLFTSLELHASLAGT